MGRVFVLAGCAVLACLGCSATDSSRSSPSGAGGAGAAGGGGGTAGAGAGGGAGFGGSSGAGGSPDCKGAKQKTSSGCDYYAVDPDIMFDATGGCFAAFVVNPWDFEVTVTVDYKGQSLDASKFGYVPKGLGLRRHRPAALRLLHAIRELRLSGRSERRAHQRRLRSAESQVARPLGRRDGVLDARQQVPCGVRELALDLHRSRDRDVEPDRRRDLDLDRASTPGYVPRA